MKRQFATTSAWQRRNADLFFADLMGRSVPPAGASQSQFEADQFLEELLGESSSAVGVAEEDFGETVSCPDREEVRQTWQALKELEKLLKADRKTMESNPLVIEVQMLRGLMDVLDMAREVPAKVWGEIWDELTAFAACDVKPLVARVKAGEKHANAVLRVLHGLTSILQGYVHDRIDDTFKSKLDAHKGWSKVAAKLVIHVIKKQVPVIQREIKANNFAAVATAFEDLKKQLDGQGFSVTGIWDVLVALGKAIIGEAINDALGTTARWAAKKLGKKLLGSAAKAASVIFILEDLALFIHAMVTISNYKDRLWEYNRVLLRFLARMRPCVAAHAGKKYDTLVGWKRAIARMDVQIVLYSFAPVKGGKAGEGEWKSATLDTTFDGKTTQLVPIKVPAGESAGERALHFEVLPVAKWPAKGGSYVALDVTTYSASGNVLTEKSMFVAAAAP